MKRFKRLMRVIGMGFFALTTCTWVFAKDNYRIAVMPFGMTEYMSRWTNAMREHPSVKDGTVKMTVLDGKFDAMVQSDQIDTAIVQQYDAIIFAPMDYDAAGAPIARATEAKIPVVSSVTRAGSDQLFGYVGTNDVEGGRLIARLATKLLNGKGNVVLLEGPIGNSPQLLRRKGIDEVLAANPDIHLLASKTANWSRAEGLAVMENWLSLYGNKVQAIIAENDAMALGAIEALRSKNIDPKTVPVISLDGVPDAQRAVQDGLLYTFYKDPLAEGQGAMDLAIRSVAGPSFQPKAALWAEGTKWQDGLGKDYDVPWIPLTQENVANFQKQ
jgi:putative xylitol transport system substrate-binding protein